MDREQQRNAIMDAFILQGQVDLGNQTSNELSDQIGVNEAEIKRLKILEVETDKLRAERDKVIKNASKSESELKDILDLLKKERITLPLAPEPAPTNLVL